MKRYTKPIHLPKPLANRRADSSLALINVVFLLLLFLIISGTLRPPLPERFEWASTRSMEGRGDIANSLVLARSGAIWSQGAPVEEGELDGVLQALAARTDRLSLQVDKGARVGAIAAFAARLKQAGVTQITFVTVEAERP